MSGKSERQTEGEEEDFASNALECSETIEETIARPRTNASPEPEAVVEDATALLHGDGTVLPHSSAERNDRRRIESADTCSSAVTVKTTESPNNLSEGGSALHEVEKQDLPRNTNMEQLSRTAGSVNSVQNDAKDTQRVSAGGTNAGAGWLEQRTLQFGPAADSNQAPIRSSAEEQHEMRIRQQSGASRLGNNRRFETESAHDGSVGDFGEHSYNLSPPSTTNLPPHTNTTSMRDALLMSMLPPRSAPLLTSGVDTRAILQQHQLASSGPHAYKNETNPQLQFQHQEIQFNPSLRHRRNILQEQRDWVDALRREKKRRARTWEQQSDGISPTEIQQRRRREDRLQQLVAEQRRIETEMQLAMGQGSHPALGIQPPVAIPTPNIHRAWPQQSFPDSNFSLSVTRQAGSGGLESGRTPMLSAPQPTDSDTGARNSPARKIAQKQPPSIPPEQPRYRLAPGEGLPLLLPSDRGILSEYQQLIRESIEFFEAQPGDISTGVQGRRKKIEPGQVGLRCRYCAKRPPHWRGRGAAYYPGTLACVYQAAQNMAANHFIKTCDDIPPEVHKKFVEARQKQEQETRRSGGKSYWMETSRHVGLMEREGKSGVWFR